jgi:hypothetical protein
MMNNSDNQFDDIRPLNDNEVPEAIAQLIADERFKRAAEPIAKPYTWEQFTYMLSTCKSKEDFQTKIVSRIMNRLIEKTTTEMKGFGWENISEDEAHLIISNHRDIVLDAAFFNMLLFGTGSNTTEIAIGDNLLIYPWIEKLVRINKSFIVKRGVSVRQMLTVSKHLSDYIHDTIRDRNQSIWLAQREGRAKDSNDRTQTSLLKMLTLHDSREPLLALKQLNIIPLSISYEYDPCDYLKAKEFQLKRDNPEHKKSQADDIENMYTGMVGLKGRVHFRLGECINPVISNISVETGRNDMLEKVADVIDKEIFKNYSFFPINYIAYDLMTGSQEFSSEYSSEDKVNFNNYIDTQIDKIKIIHKDEDFLRQKMIEMYGNTVKNHLNSK